MSIWSSSIYSDIFMFVVDYFTRTVSMGGSFASFHKVEFWSVVPLPNTVGERITC